MSFSMDVKEEAAAQISSRLHCQIAEFAAMLGLCGTIERREKNKKIIKIQTENPFVAKKCFTLLKKAFTIEDVACVVRQGSGLRDSRSFCLMVYRTEDVARLLQALRLEGAEINVQGHIADGLVIQSECCKRAFLRGAFLAVGSLSNPAKSYHMEFVCAKEGQAEQLIGVIAAFGLEAHVIKRRKASGRIHYVVYLKEGDSISDILNVMKTHVALMSMENVRIRKEIANSVNRIVNCETANIKKTVNAASSQVEDILFLEEKLGLDNLPEGLGEIAKARLMYRDVPLKELGQMMDPPIGKSGVNHRLRKLKDLADSLR